MQRNISRGRLGCPREIVKRPHVDGNRGDRNGDEDNRNAEQAEFDHGITAFASGPGLLHEAQLLIRIFTVRLIVSWLGRTPGMGISCGVLYVTVTEVAG